MTLREQLIDLITENNLELDGELSDGMSLIKSGHFDSMALFNLALWVEENIDSKVDITAIDIAEKWDTISDILDFIEKHKNHG